MTISRGKVARVHTAVASSTLGLLAVRWSTRGVVEVHLADHWQALPTPDAEASHPWVAEITALADGGVRDVGVPLDVRGTPFQHEVWEALRAVPWGTVTTYGTIAQTMGRRSAARAVAGAVAANPVALVVPCHRVVRRDGGLAGYRWGPRRKQELLARERGATLLPFTG